MNKLLDKIDDVTYKIVEAFNQFMLLVMVISVAYAVFARVVFNNPPNWGEEIGAFCLVWITFLSSVLAIRDGRHIRITILSMMTSPKLDKYLNLFSYLIVLIIGILMVRYGTSMAILSNMVKLPSTQISRAFITAAVPITGILMIIMFIGKVRELLWKSTQ